MISLVSTVLISFSNMVVFSCFYDFNLESQHVFFSKRKEKYLENFLTQPSFCLLNLEHIDKNEGKFLSLLQK